MFHLARAVPRAARRAALGAVVRLGRERFAVRVVVDADGREPGQLDALLHDLCRARRPVVVSVTGAQRSAELTRVLDQHRRADWRVRGAHRRSRRAGALRASEPPDPAGLARLARLDLLGVVEEVAGAAADRGRFGDMDDPRPALAGWLASVSRGRRLLAREPDRAGAWAALLVRTQVPRFLLGAERLDEQAWSGLRHCVADLAGHLDETGWRSLPWLTRSMTWLAVHGHRSDLETLVVRTRFDAGQVATTVRDGVVRVVSHRELTAAASLPGWCLELSEAETPLRLSLRRLSWEGETVRIELFACIWGVDTSDCAVEPSVRLVGEDAELDLEVSLGTSAEVTRWAGERHVGHDRGVLTVHLDAADVVRLGPGATRLQVALQARGVLRSGPVVHVDRYGSYAFFEPRAVDGVIVRAAHDRAQGFSFRTGPPADQPRDAPVARPEVCAVVADRATLSLRLRPAPGGPRSLALALVGPRVRLPGAVEPSTPKTGEHADWSEVVFSTQVDEWGHGPRPAATGQYRLVATDSSGLDPVPAPDLAASLPVSLGLTDHRVRVRAAPGGGLQVLLRPPLEDDVLGAHAQQRLQAAYATEDRPVDPSTVYLQSYTGQSATDSPLAIHDELRRRRPDLRLVWAVADRSSWVPAGAETVLWRSSDWYETVARAGHVVTNIDLEPWFRPRVGQKVLQCFHGYPAKSMGVRLWRSQGFTESRIEQQLDRTSRTWNLLLTPSPEMNRYYREEYRYDGEILAAGYPRDDALLATDAPDVRRRVRERLGVHPDQVLVLYAPTWRDDLATNFRAAQMANHLDTEQAAGLLGAHFALALRGHRFHARRRAEGPRSSARVLDVTDYPEINDLILACDVAVLDYSSLRFDVAVAGKPMVFLVPDLEEYTANTRGFLFDFRSSAPGPLVTGTGEVVAAVRDLDSLRESYAGEYARFNARFNLLQDGHAAQRVVDRLLDETLGEALSEVRGAGSLEE